MDRTLLIGVVLWLACPLAVGQIVFEPPQMYPAGIGSVTQATLATGDVDGDGDLDVVMAGVFSPQIKLLRNLGDGTFGPAELAHTLSPAGSPNTLTLADIDQDGHLDLILASAGAVVCLGDGTGAFGPALLMTPLPNINRVTVGEFIGDDSPDLLVVSMPFLGPVQIGVLQGLGGGAFGPLKTLFASGFSGLGVPVVADLDGDGVDDMAVSYKSGSLPQVVLVFLSRSGIAPPVSLASPSLAWVLRFADVDSDGHPDLLALHTETDQVSVRRGLGAAAFEAAVVYPVGDRPECLAVADFDADGHLDLVTGNRTDDNITLLRGLGDGQFVPALTVSNVFQPWTMAAGDLDVDGHDDLVVGSGFDVTPLVVLLNHTYAAGSAFTDFGGQGPGTTGFPILLADGQVVADSPVTLRLENGAGNGAMLALGVSPAFVPLGSGMLGPTPDVLLGPFPLGSDHSVEVTGPWPAGMPAGQEFWCQYWMLDPAAQDGLAPTSTVRLVSP